MNTSHLGTALFKFTVYKELFFYIKHSDILGGVAELPMYNIRMSCCEGWRKGSTDLVKDYFVAVKGKTQPLFCLSDISG